MKHFTRTLTLFLFISVLVGQPTFTEYSISTSADGAKFVYATDVDGDGDMDVLSASYEDDKIAWYENDGSQGFTRHTITTSASGAISVYAADVDGDGDMDVLSASIYDDKIAWYENDGSESFTEHEISTSADGADDVYAVDMDGDGDMDVLSASYFDDKIAWYEQEGSPLDCSDGDVELWGQNYSIDGTTIIDLNNSGLTGSIPTEIGCLSNLTTLLLQNNVLSGEIPESICELNISWSNDDFFNISNNQLCPPYPPCIDDYVGVQDTSNCGSLSIIKDMIPLTYTLYNAYPNPFNPVATLSYDLPHDVMVYITIYNMMGRKVKTLVNSPQTAGNKSIQWNATNSGGQTVSAGVYIYRIEAGEFKQTKKMVLLK